ncbi:MAG TPA: glycosyltransferase, partial [Mycobacteriales bacterium]|nr:glycosyltransferase [Mycobacteriales bacterium]
TYFVGPRPQDELATLFNCADVGCFPSYREPFGLVFIECMACGTPVIGADSGGPRDFVTPEVGVLVPETDDRQELARSLVAAVDRALDEDWKRTKGPAAQAYAAANFSVVHQVSELLAAVDRLIGH